MAAKIKIITASDFMEVTPDGIINIDTSKRLIVDIAKAEKPTADYELIVDFRTTKSDLSIFEVYELAAELYKHGDTFRRKVALLVLPGINFDLASFFETCSHNKGFLINAYTDYENAMRWLLSADDLLDNDVSPNKADASSAK